MDPCEVGFSRPRLLRCLHRLDPWRTFSLYLPEKLDLPTLHNVLSQKPGNALVHHVLIMSVSTQEKAVTDKNIDKFGLWSILGPVAA